MYLELSFTKGDWERERVLPSGWRCSLWPHSMMMSLMLRLPCLPMIRLSSIQMPVLVLTCLALVSPLPPAQGKGGFKCSAGNLQHWFQSHWFSILTIRHLQEHLPTWQLFKVRVTNHWRRQRDLCQYWHWRGSPDQRQGLQHHLCHLLQCRVDGTQTFCWSRAGGLNKNKYLICNMF